MALCRVPSSWLLCAVMVHGVCVVGVSFRCWLQEGRVVDEFLTRRPGTGDSATTSERLLFGCRSRAICLAAAGAGGPLAAALLPLASQLCCALAVCRSPSPRVAVAESNSRWGWGGFGPRPDGGPTCSRSPGRSAAPHSSRGSNGHVAVLVGDYVPDQRTHTTHRTHRSHTRHSDRHDTDRRSWGRGRGGRNEACAKIRNSQSMFSGGPYSVVWAWVGGVGTAACWGRGFAA